MQSFNLLAMVNTKFLRKSEVKVSHSLTMASFNSTNWRSVLLRDAALVLPRGSQLGKDQANCLAKLIEQCFCRTSMLY